MSVQFAIAGTGPVGNSKRNKKIYNHDLSHIVSSSVFSTPRITGPNSSFAGEGAPRLLEETIASAGSRGSKRETAFSQWALRRVLPGGRRRGAGRALHRHFGLLNQRENRNASKWRRRHFGSDRGNPHKGQIAFWRETSSGSTLFFSMSMYSENHLVWSAVSDPHLSASDVIFCYEVHYSSLLVVNLREATSCTITYLFIVISNKNFNSCEQSLHRKEIIIQWVHGRATTNSW